MANKKPPSDKRTRDGKKSVTSQYPETKHSKKTLNGKRTWK